MREISLKDIKSPDAKPDDGLVKQLSRLIDKVKTPVVNAKAEPAQVNVTPNIVIEKPKTEYLIEVKRDDHGRISRLLVKPL